MTRVLTICLVWLFSTHASFAGFKTPAPAAPQQTQVTISPNSAPINVPEPSTGLLFGISAVGLIGARYALKRWFPV